tara:strand:- start:18 stop:284 length:267 start_codon:yes stop_codon:yes gene_type:complete
MGDGENFGRAIKVTMLMFGPLAEKMGSREIEVSLVEGTNLIDLAQRFELEDMLSSGMRVAIDGTIESDTTRKLHDAAEIAFLPPVSGG